MNEPASSGSPSCTMASARSVAGDERERLLRRIEELRPWFHNFEIARDVWTNPGTSSPGPDYPARRWRHVEPWFAAVAGQRCLDVGCSSGFFSLKAMELGAASVLGIDAGEQGHALQQAELAAETLGLAVELSPTSVYDLDALGREFDTVFCMGVFYHLRHPLLALEAIRRVCRGTLFFQTITTANEGRSREFPIVRFVEGALAGDTSCWFVPSVEAVDGMLRSCGFEPREHVFPDGGEVILRCTIR